MTMIDHGPHVRAIGWLDAQHDFSIGESPRAFITKLEEMVDRCNDSIEALGWGMFMGCHTCNLCNEFKSDLNLGVPDGEILFVAPEMVVHYIKHHSYRPPTQFMDAVMNSPVPGTPEYFGIVTPFREKHAKLIELRVKEMYERAAGYAISSGGDAESISDAALRVFGGGDKETLERIQALVQNANKAR